MPPACVGLEARGPVMAGCLLKVTRPHGSWARLRTHWQPAEVPRCSSERTGAGFCGTGGEMGGVGRALPGRDTSQQLTQTPALSPLQASVPSSQLSGWRLD